MRNLEEASNSIRALFGQSSNGFGKSQTNDGFWNSRIYMPDDTDTSRQSNLKRELISLAQQMLIHADIPKTKLSGKQKFPSVKKYFDLLDSELKDDPERRDFMKLVIAMDEFVIQGREEEKVSNRQM